MNLIKKRTGALIGTGLLGNLHKIIGNKVVSYRIHGGTYIEWIEWQQCWCFIIVDLTISVAGNLQCASEDPPNRAPYGVGCAGGTAGPAGAYLERDKREILIRRD